MLGTLVPRVDRLPRPFARVEREFENLMDRIMGSDEGRWPVWGGFTPTFNLAETETHYEVTMELPGMKPEEFKVEVKNGELWVTGEKKEEKEEKGKTFHRIERTYGEFRRVIPLPGTVNEEKIEAEYKAGVLKVFVPKTEAAKPRHIEVKA
ncbi:MAG TPA: Hsp20/alpha crystallin family protein [Pirellulales bacterium]|nr:Hsp20/alpha crystallin family protein [Pirellulales bacterium]